MGVLSIRWRLTLWYGAVLAVVLAIFGGAVYLMMRHVLTERAGAGLLMESAEVEQEIARARNAEILSTWLERRFARHPGFDIQVSTPEGERIFRSERIHDSGLPVPTSPPAPGQSLFIDCVLDRGRFHISNRGVVGPSGPLIVQVAAPLAQNDQELGELLTVLWLAGLLALGSALVGGYLLARSALAPVDRMTAEAGTITAVRLDRRLQVGRHGDELDRLAMTLNMMIARLERSFEEIRRFTADAAHELRTPLAVIHNAAEVALSTPREAEQYRRFLEDILEEEERIKRLAEQLLFLCREDARLTPGVRQPIGLDTIVRQAAEPMGVLAAAGGVSLKTDDMSPCWVSGDPDSLRRLLFNLLDNAIKYTCQGGEIEVRCREHERFVKLTISDTGVGIPPEHIPHIFERFYRVDPARSREAGGTGLGLAICRAIVEAHGGTIELESSEGSGTKVVVSLPRLLTDAMPDGQKAVGVS
jgi:two-component system, OmpR family, heavy metal sensor histidine kinase CusS